MALWWGRGIQGFGGGGAYMALVGAGHTGLWRGRRHTWLSGRGGAYMALGGAGHTWLSGGGGIHGSGGGGAFMALVGAGHTWLSGGGGAYGGAGPVYCTCLSTHADSLQRVEA